MNHLRTKILLLSTILLCYSCGGSQMEREQKRVAIKYKNGLLFCDGIQFVFKKDASPKSRIGIWRFYYPTGQLKYLKEYTEDGELISEKEYTENGVLKYSEATSDNITNKTYYYDNGKLSAEAIIKVVTETNGDDNDTETEYETIKNYYMNGQLYLEQSFEDNVLQGVSSVWDTSGNLVLKVNYNKGFIVEE